MIYVWENANDIEEQLQLGPEHLRAYLHNELVKVIDRDDFEEGLYSHLTGGYGGIDANYIRIRIKAALNMVD